MGESHPLYIPAPYQDSAAAGRLILRDGTVATIRAAVPQDIDALADLFHRLSPESRRERFSSFSEPSPELLKSLCDSSHPERQLTLVISRLIGGNDVIVAAGSYVGGSGKSAEVSFAVEDRFQGKGIATHLLERLALLAARAGFTRFWAITQAENHGMMDVFRHSGFAAKETLDSGNIEVDFSVLPTEESVQFSEMRDRVVTAASLRWFFQPNGVAVVGASRIHRALVTVFWMLSSRQDFRVLFIRSIRRRRCCVPCALIPRFQICRKQWTWLSSQSLLQPSLE